MLITNNFNIFIPAVKSQNRQIKTNLQLKPQLQTDVVSFGSKDLLQCSSSEISAKVKASVKNYDNYLGAGAEAEVYRIPDTDYCVRVLYADDSYTSGIPNLLKSSNLKISTNLSEIDKINHNVAKFSSGTIMHYVEGSPILTPFMSEKEIKTVSKTLEEAPLSSFQKLLRQICHAYKNNMMFDCSYGNLIVNPKDKTITAIDFYNMEDFLEVSHPLSNMYSGLTHIYTTEEQKKNYASKILNAALEEVKPGQKPCCNIGDFDFYRFIYKLKEQNLIQKSTYTNLFIKLFEDIEHLKYKDIRGENVNAELLGKIKVVQTLIKQVL